MKNKTKNLFAGILLCTCFLVSACTTRAPFDQANFSVDLGYGVKMDFISVPGGTFTMRNPVTVEVELSPFALGKTEVTQAQWLVVMGNNPSFLQGENLPVESVSWEDAIKFCKKLTEREHNAGRLPINLKFTLPSKAQWEYACRAGTKTLYSFGNDGSLFPLYANFPDKSLYDTYKYSRAIEDGITDSLGRPLPQSQELNDGFADTAPVGSFRPNAWGFYDMHGNVSEWCLDHCNFQQSGGKDPIRTTPEGGESGKERVIRGGSFFLADVSAIFWRTCAPDPQSDIGFRVALVQSPNP